MADDWTDEECRDFCNIMEDLYKKEVLDNGENI